MSGCFVEGGFMAAHLDGKLDSARYYAGFFYIPKDKANNNFVAKLMNGMQMLRVPS